MLNSNYRSLCAVRLPYQGRQHYMHEFDLAWPSMALGFEDYMDTVVALTRTAGAVRGTAYMTVDEKVIEAGMSQRRPKPHVDGVFMPNLHRWGGGPGPSWNHHCNDVGVGNAARRMSVIVAASVSGCRAWRGLFDAKPKDDGDLSHLALTAGEILSANVGYVLSPDCVHESMIFDQPTRRTFLRIALPVDYEFDGGTEHE